MEQLWTPVSTPATLGVMSTEVMGLVLWLWAWLLFAPLEAEGLLGFAHWTLR